MRRMLCTAAVIAVVAASSPAGATTSLVDQHRQLITFTSVLVDGEADSDSEVFNEDEAGPVTLQDTGDAAVGASTAHAEAWQTSTISPSLISIMGATSAEVHLDELSDGFIEANGATNLTVWLDVAAPTDYFLSGGLSEGGAGNVFVQLFSQPSGSLWQFSPEADGTLPLGASGTLDPGGYILSFGSGGYAQTGFPGAVPFQTGAFDVVLQLVGVVGVPQVVSGNDALSLAPNPARSGTPVRLEVGAGLGEVTVSIVDIGGRLLSRLTAEGPTLTWDGRDARGIPAAPGVYFVRIDGTTVSDRIAIVR